MNLIMMIIMFAIAVVITNDFAILSLYIIKNAVKFIEEKHIIIVTIK